MSDKQEKTAVAISYNEQDAPKVVAKGAGELAEQIIALAEENQVLIHQDEQLADFLRQLDLGQEIPQTLYRVIAELIAFSFLLQGKTPKGWKPIPGKFKDKA